MESIIKEKINAFEKETNKKAERILMSSEFFINYIHNLNADYSFPYGSLKHEIFGLKVIRSQDLSSEHCEIL